MRHARWKGTFVRPFVLILREPIVLGPFELRRTRNMELLQKIGRQIRDASEEELGLSSLPEGIEARLELLREAEVNAGGHAVCEPVHSDDLE